MRLILIVLTLLLPYLLSGQLYTDNSTNLPDEGTMGQSMDVRAVDLDNDGDLDIVLANEFQVNTILQNQGDGTFTTLSVPAFSSNNHDSEDVAIADFNQDGHLDLLFCSEDDINLGINQVHEYYLGDGEGGFTESSFHFPDSEANAVITADLNNDNIPDVLFGNNGQNTLFINQGDGTFVDETTTRLPVLLRTTQDLLLLDVDGDNDLDLLEGNENGNALHINNGSGVFTDVTSLQLPTASFIETRKISAGDINQDGYPDLFLSNVNFLPGKNPQNRLYLNDGTGTFYDRTTTSLPVDQELTLDAIFAQLNADNYPDLVVANVFGDPSRIYLNLGDSTFVEGTTEVLGSNLYYRDALGVIEADLNGDNQLDLYFCDRNTGTANKDLYLERNGQVLSTDLSPDNQLFKVHPNPAQDYIELEFTVHHSKILSVSLTDSIGRIFDLEIPSSGEVWRHSLPANINPGWYTVIVRTEQGILSQPLLITGKD